MKLVIFDCDGTLVDSQHRIGAAMARAFQRSGFAPPAHETTRTVVGLSLDVAVSRLAPQLDSGDVHRIAENYKSAFMEIRKANQHDEPLYPGAREAVEALSARENLLLGIATGKSMKGLDKVLEREGLHSHFVTLQTADTAPSKPHPEMIYQAMRETGADAQSTVLVGDTSFDMEMAANAKVPGLGVSWGYHETGLLSRAGAFRIIDAFHELETVLDELWRGAAA